MATQNIAYGTRTEFPNDANINSLPTGQCKAIGGVTNTSTLADGFKIDIAIYLATTGVTSTGSLTFYLAESADGTTYNDGVNITTTGDQTSSIKNCPVVKTLAANANSQVVRVSWDLPGEYAPKYFSLLLSNGTGATISSTSNSAYYTPISYTVA